MNSQFFELWNYLANKFSSFLNSSGGLIFELWNCLVNKFSSFLNPSELISFLGLIVSSLTLYVAYLAYKKYIENKLQEKQLDVVLKLIEVIGNTNLCMNFHLRKSTNSLTASNNSEINQYEIIEYNEGIKILKFEKNIFELTNLSDESLFKKKYLFTDLSITASEKNKIDQLVNFSSNPILPKSIAAEVKKFSISEKYFAIGLMKNPTLNASQSFIRIGCGEEGEFSDISKYRNNEDGVAFKSWDDFIQSCQMLSESIKKWLSKHGITEINF
jgi:hypothetical protein